MSFAYNIMHLDTVRKAHALSEMRFKQQCSQLKRDGAAVL